MYPNLKKQTKTLHIINSITQLTSFAFGLLCVVVRAGVGVASRGHVIMSGGNLFLFVSQQI